MSFSEKRYAVRGWNGKIKRHLTAEQLYKQILKDSKSNYNWIAPANSIVSICEEKDFPVEYAITIKIAILNCFANIQHKINTSRRSFYHRHIMDAKDLTAITKCYNSLLEVDLPEAIMARMHYLNEILYTASDSSAIFNSSHVPGAEFRKIQHEWITKKFHFYINQKISHPNHLLKELRSDFLKYTADLKSKGKFVEAVNIDFYNFLNDNH